MITHQQSREALPQIPAALLQIGALDTSACSDVSNFCPKGKSKGYCKSTVPHVKKFMTTYCRKSCEICKGAEKIKDCVDKSMYCEHGKQMGECTSNMDYVKTFMQQNCRSTCGFCNAKKAVCKDKYSAKNCIKYKGLGYCDNLQYRNYFTRYCQKTCELCDISKTYRCGVAKARKSTSVNTIVGGETAAKGNWPWQVAILYKGKFKCGGTLVSTHYVVSAAHCFSKNTPEDYSIVLGEHHREIHEGTEQTVGVKVIVVHPSYVLNSPNDIAVVELAEKAILTKYITPACLPKAGEEVPAGKKCFMSGWGRLGAGQKTAPALQEAPLNIVSFKECLKRNKNFIRKVTSTMICAGDMVNIFASGCHGDSGGPLVCENKAGHMVLQGAVSWGSPVCDALDHFTVFTKVSAFRTWLDSIMTH